MNDLYKILDLHLFASEPEIKRAFRAMAKRWHPDHNPGDVSSAEMFKKINDAYSVLSNPVLKANYDLKMKRYIENLNAYNKMNSNPGKKNESKEREDINSLRRKILNMVEEFVFETDSEKLSPLKQKILEITNSKRIQTLKGRCRENINKLINLLYEDRY